MLYLEMAASQEHNRELRRQVEHNRLEARLAQARLSHNAVQQEARPYKSMFTSTAWRMERGHVGSSGGVSSLKRH
jgi:hypothetical protein